MTEDLDDTFARYGVDLSSIEAAESARPSPPLSPLGERLRDELLHRVGCARASLEMLEATLRNAPNDDASFDAIDAAFSANLVAARAAFERFRGQRECEGEA